MYLVETLIAKTENQLYFWTLAGLTAAIAQVNSRAKQPLTSVVPVERQGVLL
jgi:hypothetical protein